MKFNFKVINGICGGGDFFVNKIFVLLFFFLFELNMVDVDSNGGLWKVEEFWFLVIDNMVNFIFVRLGENLSCSVVIGNVEVGLEDDYLIFEVVDKLWMRVVYFYVLVVFFGIVVLVVVVVYVLGFLRSRKLK